MDSHVCRRLRVACLCGLLGAVAQATAELRAPGQVQADAAAPARLLSASDNYAARFFAVGQLRADSSCTATLVAGSRTPPASAPALILSAGHCVNYFNQNEVWLNREAAAHWRFTPAFFHDNQAQHQPQQVRRVLYATMKYVDLAVLELAATYGELAALGIRPLQLRAFSGDVRPLELLQVPVIGVDPREQFLRHAECTSQPRQALYESFAPWFWPAALGNDCAGVAGGSSGGPVVERLQDTIIGILNTTLERGYNGCGLARPCEIGANQQGEAREGASYFTAVHSLIGAFKADGSFDVGGLDTEPQVPITRPFQHVWSSRSQIPDEQGVLRPARWDLRLGEGFEQVKVKTGAARSTDCEQGAGYGAAQPIEAQPLLNLATPPTEGIYIACVIGKPVGGAWHTHASFALREIDDTPPTQKPGLARRDGDDAWRVMALSSPNELSSVMYKYDRTDQGPVDCANMQGYRAQLNNQFHALDKRWPWRFCAYGRDLADNPGPVQQADFTPAPQAR